MAVITLNGIQEKVRAVEGSGRTTPISMKNLDDRINALEGKTGYTTLVFTDYQTKTMPVGYENAVVFPCQISGWDVGLCCGSFNPKGNFTVDMLFEESGAKRPVSFTRDGRNITSSKASTLYSWYRSITLICIPQ